MSLPIESIDKRRFIPGGGSLTTLPYCTCWAGFISQTIFQIRAKSLKPNFLFSTRDRSHGTCLDKIKNSFGYTLIPKAWTAPFSTSDSAEKPTLGATHLSPPP